MTTRLAALACLGLLASPARAQFSDWQQAEDSMPVPTEPAAEPSAERANGTDEETGQADEETADAAAHAQQGEGGEEGEGDEAASEAGVGRLIGFAEAGFFAGAYDTGMAPSFVDVVALPFLVGASYQLTPHIGLGARQPFIILSHSDVPTQPGGLALLFANTELRVDLQGRVAGIRYTVGAGLTLPFLAINDFGQGVAVASAVGMAGAWDLWLWAPERLAVLARGRVDMKLATDLYLLAHLGLAAMLYIGDSMIEDDWFVAQVAAGVEYRMDAVALGGRVAAVLGSDGTLPGRNNAVQVSVVPYLRALFGDAFVQATVTVNLHSPFGFSFGSGKIWSLHLGAGTVLL